MKITYYGQSCFLVETDNVKILFDPFITPNEKAKEIDVDTIKTDYILISHGHQDHVADVDHIYQNNPNCQVVSNFEIINWFAERGVENGHPMNHGGKWKFDFGTVKMVNAIHSNCMPDGSYGGNPAGFVIQTPTKTFYFAGDTALHMDMKLIAEEYKIDFAILPIGDNFTMGIEDAVKAAAFVGTDKIVACHYDTFPYIEVDHQYVKQTANNAGKELIMLNIGQQIEL
jgi:L-ascorbate metabolism protein UlaG (beta-lactamase superfamily)